MPPGAQRGSREHALFATICCALDYQTESHRLWEAGKATWRDNSTRWIFEPSIAASRAANEILRDMQSHRFTGRYPHNNSRGVARVMQSLQQHFGGDVFRLLEGHAFDAEALWIEIGRGQWSPYFPYLRGPKVLPFWLRTVHDEIKPLRNMDKLPIAVDVNITRATYNLVFHEHFKGQCDEWMKEKVKDAWREICTSAQDPSIYPMKLDDTLWNLAKYGCQEASTSGCRMLTRCPVAQECMYQTR